MSIRAYEERQKRDDLRFGILTAVTANLMRDKKNRAAQAVDFFPSLQPKKRTQTPAQMQMALLAFAAKNGANVRRVSRDEYEAMTSA
jgi:hypothetical protein